MLSHIEHLVLYFSHSLRYTPGLDPTDIASVQSVSRRFLALGRDARIWRVLCFKRSHARTRKGPSVRLWREENAVEEEEEEEGEGRPKVVVEVHEEAGAREKSVKEKGVDRKARALANWDPSYPGEEIDYYGEYIRRHAEISTLWFRGAGTGAETLAAAGMGVLYGYDDGEIGNAQKVLAPLEDGSVGMWECGYTDSGNGLDSDAGAGAPLKQGDMIAKSVPGLLLAAGYSDGSRGNVQRTRAAMTETTAAELVSVDSQRMRGYFAVQKTVSEVDLVTMRLISRHECPFQVMALSEARASIPITVGTYKSLHLLDIRCQDVGGNDDDSCLLSMKDGDTIGGYKIRAISSTRPPVLASGGFSRHDIASTLPSPDPLSIVHLPRSAENTHDSNDIWVAGCFKTLLKYDRRSFPRLAGSVFSGARLSSICALPYPPIPPDLNLIDYPLVPISARLTSKSAPGQTIIAAGAYNQKGSLELIGTDSPLTAGETFTAKTSVRAGRARARRVVRNCVNASNSKLLSVAAHGASIAYSDGSGYIRWMERDAFTPVRKYEIKPDESVSCYDNRRHCLRYARYNDNGPQQYDDHSVATEEEAGEVSPLFQESPTGEAEGDIVKRLLPTQVCTASLFSSSSSRLSSSGLNQNDLVIWTGEGHLGLIGFGKGKLWNDHHHQSDKNDGASIEDLDGRARLAKEEAQFQKERTYGRAMRRALERQADEVSFMRGLGLGV